MADSNKTLLWVCGHPCSGKTWIGDYLESRGYKHIDGDYHLQNQKKSEESKRIADGLLGGVPVAFQIDTGLYLIRLLPISVRDTKKTLALPLLRH